MVRTHETRLGPNVLPGPHPNTVIGNNVTIGHQVIIFLSKHPSALQHMQLAHIYMCSGMHDAHKRVQQRPACWGVRTFSRHIMLRRLRTKTVSRKVYVLCR